LLDHFGIVDIDVNGGGVSGANAGIAPIRMFHFPSGDGVGVNVDFSPIFERWNLAETGYRLITKNKIKFAFIGLFMAIGIEC
jgi:hypothetical protein